MLFRRSLFVLLFLLFACRTPKPKEPILTPPSPDPTPTPKAVPGFAVAFSTDATQALLLQNKTLTKFSLQGETPQTQTLTPKGIESAQAIAFTDKWLVAAFSTGETKLFSFPDGAFVSAFSPNQNSIAAVALSNSYIATGYNNGTISVFDINQKKVLFSSNEKASHKERITSLSFSSDGNFLLSASTDKRLKLWSIPEQTLRETFTGHSRAIWSAVLSSSIISSSEDGSIRGWLLSGQERFFRLDSAPLLAAGASGSRLVALKSRELLLLDANSGAMLSRLAIEAVELRGAVYQEASRTVWAISKEGKLFHWVLPEEIAPEPLE